jgi:23S rRNA (uracil1939-C5)-methyltransferase
MTNDSQLVQIEKPIYGGAFLARLEGKAIFVPLALPREQVRVRVVEDKRGYANAEALEIVTPAAERVPPACRHFGACGGCDYQHASYEAQLVFKQAILRETLERGGVPAPAQIDVLAANPWGYRNRIRLAMDAAGRIGYRGRRSHAVVPIAECPIAAPLLVRAALAIQEIAAKSFLLLRKTEVSLFCDAEETALLIGVHCERPLKFALDGFCAALAAKIPEFKGAEHTVEGSAGRPQTTVARHGDTSLSYRAAGFAYRVDHGAFFQVNRYLVDTLVDAVTAGRQGGLAWDSFAGVGLFARQLASSFTRVVAVESAPNATAALAHNLSGTGARAVKMSTLEFLRRGRNGEQPDLIVVDPPRTGLGAETTTLLSGVGAPALVYVSCDPATLARDLRALTASGYAIEKITLADLFPQTFHLETIVHLRR